MSTDPAALAREVLDAAHEDETVTVCTIPDNKTAALARTVLAIESALDGLERDTDAWENDTRAIRGGELGPDESAILCARETENRIRAALNGDNK